MKAGVHDEYRAAWLGGEAHVRDHNRRSVWRRLLANKQHVSLTFAFLVGAAIGSGAAVLACARKASAEKARNQDRQVHR